MVTTLETYLSFGSIRYLFIKLTQFTLHYVNITPTLVQAYDTWIQKELGEALRVAKMATGDVVYVSYRVINLIYCGRFV